MANSWCTTFSGRHHSVGSGQLRDRKCANSLLTPGWCITVTRIDLGFIDLNTVQDSSLQVFEIPPHMCIYDTVAVLLDFIKIVWLRISCSRWRRVRQTA